MGLGTALESIGHSSDGFEWPTELAPYVSELDSNNGNLNEKSLIFPSLNAFGRNQNSFTYDELLSSTKQTINALSALSVTRNESVAVFLPHIPQAYCAVWAAETIGVAAPLNVGASQERISGFLAAAKPRILITLGPLPGVDIWEKSVSALEHTPSVQVLLVVDLKLQLSKTTQLMASLYSIVDSFVSKSAEPQTKLTKREVLDFDEFVTQQPIDQLPLGVNFNSQRLDTFFEL